MKNTIVLVVVAALVGAGASLFAQTLISSKDKDIASYYRGEVAANVSPHELEERLIAGDEFIIVDLRDKASFAAGHVVGAINITGNEEEIVAAFAKLPQDTEIITYCYDIHCMLSRKVGDILARHGMYVKHLTSGFEELEKGKLEVEYLELDPTKVGGTCTIDGLGC